MSYNPRYRASYNPKRIKKMEARQRNFSNRNSLRNRFFRRAREMVGGVTSWFKISTITNETPGKQLLGSVSTPVEIEIGSQFVKEDEPTLVDKDAQVLLREITYAMAHGDLDGNIKFTKEAWEKGVSSDETTKADVEGIHQWTEVIMNGIERR